MRTGRTAAGLVCALFVFSTGPSAAISPAPLDDTGADSLLDIPWSTPLPQAVVPGFVLVPRPVVESSRKTESRTDQQFFEISSTGSNDIPDAALRAYQRAASVMSACAIPWTFLAAVGRVESDHGRYGGSQLGSDGVSRPEIIGPQLNGAGPFAAISDSDDGKLDRDKLWDRAVGQMQFIPGTWRMVARDGDGDGSSDPHDIDDSALAAAAYLCGAGNLGTLDGMARAAYRYNQSDYYVQLVLSFHQGYQTGVFAVPSPPPPKPKPPQPPPTPVSPPPSPTPSPVSPSPTAPPSGPTPAGPTPAGPTPAGPTPTEPSPTASPPPPPAAADHTGEWGSCEGGWCLGAHRLDLSARGLDAPAAHDYDGDGGPETNRAEFDGLVERGQPVTVHGILDGGVIRVEKVAGLVYG